MSLRAGWLPLELATLIPLKELGRNFDSLLNKQAETNRAHQKHFDAGSTEGLG